MMLMEVIQLLMATTRKTLGQVNSCKHGRNSAAKTSWLHSESSVLKNRRVNKGK
jgi:hypothetical protein